MVNIIGDEQPRALSDMTPQEQVAWLHATVISIIGQEPQRPYYPSVDTQGPNVITPPGATGVTGITGGALTPANYPNAAQMSADYIAAVNAWNEKYKLNYTELVARSKVSAPAPTPAESLETLSASAARAKRPAKKPAKGTARRGR